MAVNWFIRIADVNIQVLIVMWWNISNAMFLFRLHLKWYPSVILGLMLPVLQTYRIECIVGVICGVFAVVSVCPIALMMVVPHFCLNNWNLHVSYFRIYVLMDAGECEILIIMKKYQWLQYKIISLYKGNISWSALMCWCMFSTHLIVQLRLIILM